MWKLSQIMCPNYTAGKETGIKPRPLSGRLGFIHFMGYWRDREYTGSSFAHTGCFAKPDPSPCCLSQALPHHLH